VLVVFIAVYMCLEVMLQQRDFTDKVGFRFSCHLFVQPPVAIDDVSRTLMKLFAVCCRLSSFSATVVYVLFTI